MPPACRSASKNDTDLAIVGRERTTSLSKAEMEAQLLLDPWADAKDKLSSGTRAQVGPRGEFVFGGAGSSLRPASCLSHPPSGAQVCGSCWEREAPR
jgi:hypothetical protein